jgi:hypothetical protein
MIIEVALGIVLAVVILRYWDAILGLGLLAVFGGIALAVLGVVVYVAFQLPQDAWILIGVVAIIGVALWLDSHHNMKYKKPAPLEPPSETEAAEKPKA